ncbi:MAG: hypothetical protein WAU91_19735 [Desulfatitalea sp.]
MAAMKKELRDALLGRFQVKLQPQGARRVEKGLVAARLISYSYAYSKTPPEDAVNDPI